MGGRRTVMRVAPSLGHLDGGRLPGLDPVRPLLCDGCKPARHPGASLLGCRRFQSGTRKAGRAMPIDPTDLAKSIGGLGSLDPHRGLAPTCSRSPTPPSSCSQPMGRAHAGRCRRPAALGQRLRPGCPDRRGRPGTPGSGSLCGGFSQRLPAAIRDLDREPDWAEFTQMLVGEGDRCGLECPGGAGRWGPWDPGWLCRSAVGLGSQRGRGLAGYAGLVASLLSAATTAQVKGGWLRSWRPPWSIAG
jgi:hypothetical protein